MLLLNSSLCFFPASVSPSLSVSHTYAYTNTQWTSLAISHANGLDLLDINCQVKQ